MKQLAATRSVRLLVVVTSCICVSASWMTAELKRMVELGPPAGSDGMRVSLIVCGDSTIRDGVQMLSEILPLEEGQQPEHYELRDVYKQHRRTWGGTRINIEFHMHKEAPGERCLHSLARAKAGDHDNHDSGGGGADVVIAWVNFAGLHHLHVLPVYGWPSYIKWAEYYHRGRVALQKVLKESDFLIFQTTNWVCDDKYVGSWRDVLFPEYDPMPCVANTLKKNDTKPFLQQQLQQHKERNLTQDCMYSTMTGKNSERLYRQEMSLYNNNFASDPRVYLYDSFNETKFRCSKTGDGRHYGGLVPQKMENVLLYMKHMITAKGTN